MKMGYSEIRPGYDYHLARSKLQESTCKTVSEVDIVGSLLTENNIRRAVKMVNYILLSVKIVYKYMDKMFRRIFIV